MDIDTDRFWSLIIILGVFFRNQPLGVQWAGILSSVTSLALLYCNFGASTGQKYWSTSTNTWKNDEYEYKYKYWISKSTWVQLQVLLKVIEYKYRVLWL